MKKAGNCHHQQRVAFLLAPDENWIGFSESGKKTCPAVRTLAMLQVKIRLEIQRHALLHTLAVLLAKSRCRLAMKIAKGRYGLYESESKLGKP